MFERRERIREWFYEVVAKFRQKGAISPEKAMTAEELSLPPRFEDAMKRRLGRLCVFIEVNGKYYLSEERLKQIEQLRSTRGAAWNPRKRMLTLRIIQMITIALFVALLLTNLSVQSWQIRVISSLLLVVWLIISVLQVYNLLRIRRRTSTFTQIGKPQAGAKKASPLNASRHPSTMRRTLTLHRLTYLHH
jgi:hypothetical protein